MSLPVFHFFRPPFLIWRGVEGKVCAQILLLLLFTCAYTVEVTTFGNNAVRLEPGFMGPNALPVPIVNNACVADVLMISLSGQGHYDPSGDKTVNPEINLEIPLGQAASFAAHYQPLEYFSTTPALRDKRFAQRATGIVPGDLSLQTKIQILKSSTSPLGLLFDAVIKTTTGKGLESARHINAPAYFFTLTAGKPVVRSSYAIRLLASASFIAWQVNVNEQNDAVGYGCKVLCEKNSWESFVSMAGYHGWIGHGDNPLAAATGIMRSWKNGVGLFCNFKYGIIDQAQYCGELGISYRFK